MKYVLYDKKRGLFLGVLAGYAIFSEQDVYETTRLPSFETRDIAEKFVDDFLPKMKKRIEYLEITDDSDSDYVHIADIIKSGYKEQSVGMFEKMYTEPTIH